MEFDTFKIVIAIFLIILLWYIKKLLTYNHWKNIGIPGPIPYPIFGNFPRSLLFKTSFTQDIRRIYNEWKDKPYFGVFNGRTPYLIVNDLELVKTILIKEFNTFPGRGFKVPENSDTLAANIFSLDGHRWRVLRSKLTPAFTTGKLKHMVDLMTECADHFVEYLRDEVQLNDVIEVREAAARFTTDVIGSCAFGIHMNALSMKDSEFRRIGKKIFEPSKVQLLRKVLREVAPRIINILERFFSSKETMNFFVHLIKETIRYREEENIVRNDLVDLLKNIKNKKHELDIQVTDTLLAAQAVTFFAAGFETSSTTISFALFELAFDPEIQDTLRHEITTTLAKHQGKISYEILNEMQFLNMVVEETLRKNTPAGVVRRTSAQSWTIPGTEITLPAGTNVMIPVDAFHHDSNLFPHPEVFDPLRFDDEGAHVKPMSYLPFGSGPKNCIGDRFAGYQVKLGIISVLSNFIIEPSVLIKKNYEIEKAAIVLTMKGGVPLKFKPIYTKAQG